MESFSSWKRTKRSAVFAGLVWLVFLVQMMELNKELI